MSSRQILHALLLGLGLSRLVALPALAGWIEEACPEEAAPAPHHVVVFIPGFEGSALVDPAPEDNSRSERVVWDGQGVLADYAALHPANHLEARPLLQAGARDLGAKLAYVLTHPQKSFPAFRPLAADVDFFTFAYDWRAGIRETLAPALEAELRRLEQVVARRRGVSPASVRFVLVAHGAGGLVARTLVSAQPRLADRIERLYLVGTPNLGTAHALKALLTGTGRVEADGDTVGWGGLLAQMGAEDRRLIGTRVLAMGLPSLYQLLPMRQPKWVRDTTNPREPTIRVAGVDMLTLGTWADFWPSAQNETEFMIQQDLVSHRDRETEPVPEKWMHHHDAEMHRLQTMLMDTREWRLALGTVGYTARLLQRAGEPSRLRLVAARGVKTPTGLVSEGTHGDARVRFMYGPFADGDGLVTLESAVEDLRDPSQVIVLDDTGHDAALSHPRFLVALLKDLTVLQQKEATVRAEVALSAN